MRAPSPDTDTNARNPRALDQMATLQEQIAAAAPRAVACFLIQDQEGITDEILNLIMDNFGQASPVECARALFIACIVDEDMWEGWTYDPCAHVAYHHLPRLLRAFGIENDEPSQTAGISEITARCGKPIDDIDHPEGYPEE